mmetsp:Transcript_26033/g.83730  ORF Transcript_26033/g.83730 Transcript_26033/m.83730 type:complete len:267 (-) Transcript_26033:233-1033(-)
MNSVMEGPGSKDSTNTRRDHRMGVGNTTVLSFEKLDRKRRRWSASTRKSSCEYMKSSKRPTHSDRQSHRSEGIIQVSSWAVDSMRRTSRSNARRTPGRCTLTATTREGSDRSLPLCTWAMQPWPTGTGSSDSNTDAGKTPNSSSNTCCTSRKDMGATSSCRAEKVWHMSTGNTSGRVLAHWPSLTKVGPARCTRRSDRMIHHRHSLPPANHASGSVSAAGLNRTASSTARSRSAANPRSLLHQLSDSALSASRCIAFSRASVAECT